MMTATATDKIAYAYIASMVSYEQIHDNNPQESPIFIEDGLIFFTHIDDQ